MNRNLEYKLAVAMLERAIEKLSTAKYEYGDEIFKNSEPVHISTDEPEKSITYNNHLDFNSYN